VRTDAREGGEADRSVCITKTSLHPRQEKHTQYQSALQYAMTLRSDGMVSGCDVGESTHRVQLESFGSRHRSDAPRGWSRSRIRLMHHDFRTSLDLTLKILTPFFQAFFLVGGAHCLHTPSPLTTTHLWYASQAHAQQLSFHRHSSHACNRVHSRETHSHVAQTIRVIRRPPLDQWMLMPLTLHCIPPQPNRLAHTCRTCTPPQHTHKPLACRS
jgi:hypothetical protein